jgi:hypothetical protein
MEVLYGRNIGVTHFSIGKMHVSFRISHLEVEAAAKLFYYHHYDSRFRCQILEENALSRFPNRIWRRNLLHTARWTTTLA